MPSVKKGQSKGRTPEALLLQTPESIRASNQDLVMDELNKSSLYQTYIPPPRITFFEM